MELLILIAVLLTIVAIAKVLKAKELVDGFKDPESEPISSAEVKANAVGMLVWGVVFFTLVVVMLLSWGKYLLPSSAAAHGDAIDTLLVITWYLIFSVFFLTHILLFWFTYKYHYKAGKKAFWFPHDNKLEMAWTVVPAAVLILLVTYGMNTWSETMYPEKQDDAVRIEIVSEQFKWTTRYAGADEVLGEASFSLYGKNSVGVATKYAMDDRIKESNVALYGVDGKKGLVKDSLDLEKMISEGWNKSEDLSKIEQSIKNYKANIRRLNKMLVDYAANPAKYDAGKDDQVINGDTIYFPKGKQVILQFRSKDVIHSAYLPHFRVQMNTVPGMRTGFTFTPTRTDAEMLAAATAEGKKFTGYILLCNKICGASHFNMKLHVKVVEPAEYDKWIAQQGEFAKVFK